jgi:acyl carrier protein
MIPSAIVVLDQFPKTPGGKIDRLSLPEPKSGEQLPSQPHQGARSALERVLVQFFEETLHREAISIYDVFFDLGGHSLSATLLTSRIRETLHVELPLQSFFEYPSVAALSARMLQVSVEPPKLERTAELLLQVQRLSEQQASELLVPGHQISRSERLNERHRIDE